MIKVTELSYGVPSKELYDEISFTIEKGQHCALIGSNGSGKSTLVDMIMRPEEYLYDGKIERDEECRVGYASQFTVREKDVEYTVFEYLSERFLEVQDKIAKACDEMAACEDMEAAFEKYQELLDLSESMDADNYESNILKQLAVAGMSDLAETKIAQLSGGEYKLVQIQREMLLKPNLLVLDEPDVFLDFENLNGLCKLINGYKGTMLVVTHNRYLLNHCFGKILHLENGEMAEYEGGYTAYRCAQIRQKLELKLQYMEEHEEIERTQEMVNILRKRATELVNPAIGRSVNAKQSQLDRLRARHIDDPFIEVREPRILLPQVEPFWTSEAKGDEQEEEIPAVLTVASYGTSFEKELLEDVNFEIKAGEKVSLVGPNGTGKTTLMRDIMENNHPAITINSDAKVACLSQLQGDTLNHDETVYTTLNNIGFGTYDSMYEYLAKYCLKDVKLEQKVGDLSGGEQNLLQLALLEKSDADFLILDEPTSHLDIYAQTALERAIDEYPGTVLMVTHDFYLTGNCADYVLIVDDNSIRRTRTRKFRKMVYDKYFDHEYLEMDKKKQEVEEGITQAFKNDNFDLVEKLCEQLETLGGIVKEEQ